ncbi:hypothetical protein HRM2_p00290 (plasmid) [Desulforapulum autotrophicum HRM2]|uniref:Uncharacterized protein n=1 Tax=Desulforapulum autotrophicum (strain ATCC 43914 / DSM 3382 / VKM B-1955 / HRM2) TaxID=177437 RepID=C0QMM9_DESAH|nr:hypothetical protein HRM2_p00290 [Desulforapulum autotrophicum HRM2]
MTYALPRAGLCSVVNEGRMLTFSVTLYPKNNDKPRQEDRVIILS